MKHAKKIVGLIIAITAVLTIFFISFFLSFKSKYNGYICEVANNFGIDYSLALAITKAESKFDENAKSVANAIGLMQIKLDTANYVQSIYGDDNLTESQLFEPKININCGIKYIKYLFSKFENVDVVICAYNAGETIVRAWLNDFEFSQDGKTLSKIPYKETENYLKKVSFCQKIYKKMSFLC